MAIFVSCPSCLKEYNVKDEAAGKRFQCKDCGAIVEVPAASTAGLDEDDGDRDGASDADPFGDTAAPAPSRRPQTKSTRGGSAAREKTMLPAIFIYVVSALSMLYWIANAGTNVMGVDPPPMFQNQPNLLGPGAQMVLGLILSGLGFFRDIFIVFAARKLQVCQSYGVALTGAILCVVPCVGSPCCVMGIPFGIWALVVLNNPDVKSAFS